MVLLGMFEFRVIIWKIKVHSEDINVFWTQTKFEGQGVLFTRNPFSPSLKCITNKTFTKQGYLAYKVQAFSLPRKKFNCSYSCVLF